MEMSLDIIVLPTRNPMDMESLLAESPSIHQIVHVRVLAAGVGVQISFACNLLLSNQTFLKLCTELCVKL